MFGLVLAVPAQRVCPWLDELAPGEGAFAHALEWAGRLGWPLRVLTTSGNGRGPTSPQQDDRLQVCEAACLGCGVGWDGTGDGAAGDGLYVLCDALPEAQRRTLLRQVLRLPRAGVLLCPRAWQPVSRLMVVVQGRDPASAFLDAAAGLCRSLGAEPVVLTLARSEGEARRRERFAAERFAGQRTAAEFDSVVGGGLQESVAWVARLRRCPLVVVEREAPSWWRRFRGETVERLLGLPETSVLALPRTGLPVAGGRAPVAAGSQTSAGR